MWYRISKVQSYDKSNPSYESKMIAYLAKEEIRDLLAKQTNYNPTDLELESKVRRLFKYLQEECGGIENVRLKTEGEHLGPYIKSVVYKLFQKKNAKRY
jgi:hypothetical protein